MGARWSKLQKEFYLLRAEGLSFQLHCRVYRLLAGFRCGTRADENRRELDQFLDSPKVDVVPVNEETAEFYAEIFRGLREKGRPIPSNDLWLAAGALQHGLALVTRDGHFAYIDGLLLAPV